MNADQVLPGDEVVDPGTGIRFRVKSVEISGDMVTMLWAEAGPRLGLTVPRDRSMRGRRPIGRVTEVEKATIAGAHEQ